MSFAVLRSTLLSIEINYHLVCLLCLQMFFYPSWSWNVRAFNFSDAKVMGSFARELIKHVPWIRFALERNVCRMHTCTYKCRNMRRSWWSYRPSMMQNKSPKSNSRKTLQPWEHHTRPDSLLWRGPELVEHILLVMLKLQFPLGPSLGSISS